MSKDWKRRRRLVTVLTAFCLAVIGKIVLSGSDTETDRVVIMSAFGLLTLLANGYIFAAAWDDKGTKT